jgi:phage-related protein
VPLDTFAPTTQPSPSSTQEQGKQRVNTAQFGDGYSQRSMDGLNASPRTFTAQWDVLASTEADIYQAFFDAHSVTPFLWTPPLESVQRKLIAGTWTRGYVGASTVTLACPMSEVFDQ